MDWFEWLWRSAWYQRIPNQPDAWFRDRFLRQPLRKRAGRVRPRLRIRRLPPVLIGRRRVTYGFGAGGLPY